MADASSNNTHSGNLEERVDILESRMFHLEESVHRAVGALLRKMDALSCQKNEAKGSAASSPAPPRTATTSLLELAERGDGETLFRVLADEQVDLRSNPPRTSSGDTPLHVAASGGHLKAVMALLGAGAHVDVLGHRLRTPLHCGAAHGHLAVAQRLMFAGAKVDVKDADGATALELAVGKGHKDVVELFLEKGVAMDQCIRIGEPSLVQAAREKSWEIVDLLLKKGASATKCKEDKECALVLASRDGQADAVRHLLRRGAASNTEQVKWALGEAKSADVVWAFVDAVSDQVRGEAGRWGLMRTACGGRLEPLVALLEAGVNIKSRYVLSQTALHFASDNGHVECVRELIRRGAHVNARSIYGDTPLHFASYVGRAVCVNELTVLGADINAKNKKGDTPLHCASESGHVACLCSLLAAGAKVSVTNNKGKTALDVAMTKEVRRVIIKR